MENNVITITSASEADFDRLTEIWEAAVRATHDFLSEEDVLFYKKQVRELYLGAVSLFVARDKQGLALAFMGLSPPDKLEMLFVDPAYRGQGVGTALVRHAAEEYGSLDVDVNEQNPLAVDFYKKRGFVRVGRSELDGQGRPFPLIHMRLNAFQG